MKIFNFLKLKVIIMDKILDGNSLGLRTKEKDFWSSEDEVNKRNNVIMNNYIENNKIRFNFFKIYLLLLLF